MYDWPLLCQSLFGRRASSTAVNDISKQLPGERGGTVVPSTDEEVQPIEKLQVSNIWLPKTHALVVVSQHSKPSRGYKPQLPANAVGICAFIGCCNYSPRKHTYIIISYSNSKYPIQESPGYQDLQVDAK